MTIDYQAMIDALRPNLPALTWTKRELGSAIAYTGDGYKYRVSILRFEYVDGTVGYDGAFTLINVGTIVRFKPAEAREVYDVAQKAAP